MINSPAVFLLCTLFLSSSWCHETGSTQQVLGDATTVHPKRVAIIGAGSGGASTAYYLQQYATAAGIALELDVFERSSHIGGRSTTVFAHDDPAQPFELGASIFVNANLNLVSAVKTFGLSIADDDDDASDNPETLGIWNGEQFVWTQPLGGSRYQSWWSRAKLFYRYGMAPLRTLRLVKDIVDRFLKMYEEPHFPWYDLSQVAYDVGLTAITAANGEQYLANNGLGGLFAKELIQASTRVNYAQNLGNLHGLETLVCMATDGAMSVKGGNWQIFAKMLNASGATLHLNTSAITIEKRENGRFVIDTKLHRYDFWGSLMKYFHSGKKIDPVVDTSFAGLSLPEEIPDNVLSLHRAEVMTDNGIMPMPYDAVVLAAPYQYASLEVTPELKHVPDPIDYVKLHVTLFSTSRLLSPSFFHLPDTALVPTFILTTLHPSENATAGVGRAEFFSISQVGTSRNPHTGLKEDVYKIFSNTSVEDSYIHKLIGLPTDTDAAPNKHVSWIHRKVWNSYPYLHPRITFEPLELDDNIWYTSGIESFISTMETSSLMGKNIARLIVNRWLE